MLLLLVLIFTAPVAFGQDGDQSFTFMERWDRFRLWNYCRPVVMLVSDLPSGTKRLGLEIEDIEVAVRSRLRSARIFAEDYSSNPGQLSVVVNVAGEAYSLDVEYRKRLDDSASGETLFTGTWEAGVTGIHGQVSTHILSALSHSIDLFIDDYLRVNEEKCSQ